MLFSKRQAKEFFHALRESSVEIMEYYGIATSPGNKTRSWKNGHAVGVTEHYTAGVSWKGACRHLNSGDNQKSSCHLVIADRRVAEVDDVISKYPILDQLPVQAVLLAELDEGTWHAGWSNSMNFGIENRNAGMLRGENNAWTWWPNNWTRPFPHQELGKTPINIDGQWWEPYTHGQIVANIIICQMMYCLYGGDMDQRWFLPHSCISGTKMDTGRAFPLDNVRDAIFRQVPHDELMWMQSFKSDPMYMNDYDEDEDHEFLMELQERQGERDEEFTDEDDEQCLAMPSADIQLLIDDGNWKDELDAVRRGLTRLGYVTGGLGPEMDEDTSQAVWMFQKSMKLTTDSIPGSKTQQALYKRLKHFDLEK